MPQLPENNEYISNVEKSATSRIPAIMKALNARGTPTGTTAPTGVKALGNFQAGGMFSQPSPNTDLSQRMQTGVTTSVYDPIAKQSTPGKFEPIPQELNKDFLPTDVKDPSDPRWVAPSESAKIRNWPESLGGGQYAIDQTQPGELIKSARDVDSKDKILLRGGLSPLNYQIDHIIPLWLGGVNTTANLQLLDVPTHERKTDAQAVALTLLSHGKIDLQQAKSLAFTWKDKDLTGVPHADEYGTIPVDVAEKTYKRWQDQEKAGIKPNVTLKDVLKEIPESAKNFGKGWLPDFIREPIKGFVSGFTAGVVPYTPGENENWAEKGLGYAGDVLGTVVGFGKFAKGLNLAKDAVMTLPGLGRLFAKAAPVVGEAIDAGATTLKSVNRIKKMETLSKIVKDAGVMTAYGQTAQSISDLMPYTPEEEKTFSNHVKRFFFDAAYGGMLGSAPQSIKGYSTIAAGATTLGLIQGDDIQDALLNGAIMTGLHGLGRGQTAKTVQEVADREVSKAAVSKLSQWAEGVKPVKKGEVVPERKVSIDEAINLQSKALENINKSVRDGNMSLDDAAKERGAVIAAGSHLYNQSLPPAQRAIKETNDILSLGERMRTKPNALGTTPEYLKNVVDNNPLNLPDTAAKLPEGNFPTGRQALSGVASQINDGKTRANILRLSDAIDAGKASNRVYLVEQSELEPFIKGINSTITDKEIKNLVHKPSANPHNNVRAFGVIENPGGGKEIVDIGWFPRKFTIDEKVNNINENVDKFPPKENGQPLERFDSSFNKDLIADNMRKNGIRVLTANLEKIEPKVAISKQPFQVVSINPQNWAESLAFKNNVPHSTGDSIPEALSRLKRSKDAKEIANTATKIQESLKVDPDNILDVADMPGMEAEKSTVSSIINIFKDALRSKTPQEFTKKITDSFGPITNDVAAKHILNNRERFSVKNAFDLIQNGIKSKSANPETTAVYKELVLPFFKSPQYQMSELKGYLPGMPIASKTSLKRPVEAPIANETVKEVQPTTPVEKAPQESIISQKIVDTAKKNTGYKKPTTPLQKRVESIKQELTLRGEDALENAVVSSSDFNRESFIKNLNDTLRALDVEYTNKNLPKEVQLSQTEYAGIKKNIIDKLKLRAEEIVLNKFSIDNELKSGFLPERIASLPTEEQQKKALIEETRRALGIFPEKTEVEGAPAKESKPLPDKKGIESINIANFAKTIRDNIKQFPKDTYAYGFAKMLDEGLSRAFGKNYNTSWSLDPYFSINSPKGKYFFGNLYKTLNQNSAPRSQPKDVVEKFVNTRRLKGEVSKKDVQDITKERVAETKQATEDRGSIENKEQAAQANEAGFSIKDMVQGEDKNITDLTRFDELSPGRLSGELGRKTDALDGAQDAKALVSSLISEFNRNVDFDNKRYGTKKKKVTFTDLKDIESNISKETKRILDSIENKPKEAPKAEEPKVLPAAVSEAIDEIKAKYPQYFK